MSLPLLLEHLPLIPKHSKRAHRVALRLNTKERQFHLVIPKGMSEKRAYDFALKHKVWMEEKLSSLPSPIYLDDCKSLSILGKERVIKIEKDTLRKTTRFTLTDTDLIIKTNKNDFKMRLIRHLKKECKEHLKQLSKEKAARIHKTIGNISVRDTTSRWGSCSPDKNLSYSWRLIFAPEYVIDYIVAHEVAHLEHMNHSSAFWTLCKELSDNYDDGKRWISDNSHELMRYT